MKLIWMVRNQHDLDRLAGELAELSSEERTRVIAEALRRSRPRRTANGFDPPVLLGGTAWIDGSP